MKRTHLLPAVALTFALGGLTACNAADAQPTGPGGQPSAARVLTQQLSDTQPVAHPDTDTDEQATSTHAPPPSPRPSIATTR